MVFFNGERGSETFPGYGLFDTSINYNIPVFRTLRPWVKFDVYNLFNNQKLIGWNTAVTQNAASAKDNLGLATGYTKGRDIRHGDGQHGDQPVHAPPSTRIRWRSAAHPLAAAPSAWRWASASNSHYALRRRTTHL